MKALATAFVITLCLTAPTFADEGFERLETGQQVADMTVADVEGNQKRLSDLLDGEANVVVFWASWSSRSIEALRDMNRLLASNPSAIRVIGVNVESGTQAELQAARIRNMIEKTSLSFPILVDRDHSVYDGWGVTAVPSFALLDSNLRVVDLMPGYPDPLRQGFAEKVLEASGLRSSHRAASRRLGPSCMPEEDAAQWFDKGKALVELGKVNEGILYLSRAVAEAPYYAESVAYLAEVLDQVGRADEAARLRGVLDSISSFCLVRRVP